MPMMPTHASDAFASRTYQSGKSGVASRSPNVNTKCRSTNERKPRWPSSSATKPRTRVPSDAPGAWTTGGWSGRRMRFAK